MKLRHEIKSQKYLLTKTKCWTRKILRTAVRYVTLGEYSIKNVVNTDFNANKYFKVIYQGWCIVKYGINNVFGIYAVIKASTGLQRHLIDYVRLLPDDISTHDICLECCPGPRPQAKLLCNKLFIASTAQHNVVNWPPPTCLSQPPVDLLHVVRTSMARSPAIPNQHFWEWPVQHKMEPNTIVSG